MQGGGIPGKGSGAGVDGPHDSADSSTGLFRSRSLLPAPSGEPRQLGFSEAWRMVRFTGPFDFCSRWLWSQPVQLVSQQRSSLQLCSTLLPTYLNQRDADWSAAFGMCTTDS